MVRVWCAPWLHDGRMVGTWQVMMRAHIQARAKKILPRKAQCLQGFQRCDQKKCLTKVFSFTNFGPESTPLLVHQNLYTMSQQTYTPTHCPETGRKFTKAERKAANQAKYAAERAAQTASKPKPTKVSVPVSEAALMRKTKAELVGYVLGLREAIDEYVAQRDAKPKAKRKAVAKGRKASPSERVADKQERGAHGAKGVGPIEPQPEGHTADTKQARKLTEASGERNRRKQAKKLAMRWAFAPNYGGMFLEGQQAELQRLLGDVDVSTYEDVMAAVL